MFGCLRLATQADGRVSRLSTSHRHHIFDHFACTRLTRWLGWCFFVLIVLLVIIAALIADALVCMRTRPSALAAAYWWNDERGHRAAHELVKVRNGEGAIAVLGGVKQAHVDEFRTGGCDLR